MYVCMYVCMYVYTSFHVIFHFVFHLILHYPNIIIIVGQACKRTTPQPSSSAPTVPMLTHQGYHAHVMTSLHLCFHYMTKHAAEQKTKKTWESQQRTHGPGPQNLKNSPCDPIDLPRHPGYGLLTNLQIHMEPPKGTHKTTVHLKDPRC